MKRTVVSGLVAAVLVAVPAGIASAASLPAAASLASAGSFPSAAALAGSSSPLASPSLQGATTGATSAEIASLRAQIAAQGGRIHELTESYSKAATEASILSQQLVTQRQDLVGLRRDLGGAQAALRRAAIQAYTGTGISEPDTSVRGSTEAAIGTEYLNVASGDVSNLEDSYQLDQLQVGSAISRLSDEQRANTAALHEAATARSQALATADDEQGQLATLDDRLASLEKSAVQGGPANDGLVKSTVSQTQPTAPTTAPPSSPSTTVPPAPAPTTTVPATTATTAPPQPTAPPPPAAGTGGGGAGGVWLELRECESGNNYQENTGNGFYGAYQFTQQTWTGLGYPGRPDLEPPAMQDAAAMKLQAEAGWGQWPACSASLGLT